jgi:hypothetical protein
MRIRKAAFIILTVFTSRIIISCCDCPMTTEYQYSFDYISLYNLDNSGKDLIISQTNIIPKKAYAILIDFSLLKVSLNNFQLEGFPAANAIDCFCPPETRYSPKDTITSITITTIKTFDNQHPAESDISSFFKLLGFDRYIPIQEFLSEPERIYEYTKPENEKIELFLLQPPSVAGEYSFKVEVILSDSRLLSMTTNPVILE